MSGEIRRAVVRTECPPGQTSAPKKGTRKQKQELRSRLASPFEPAQTQRCRFRRRCPCPGRKEVSAWEAALRCLWLPPIAKIDSLNNPVFGKVPAETESPCGPCTLPVCVAVNQGFHELVEDFKGAQSS